MSEQEETLSIQQAIDRAVQHHKAGRVSEAENIYQQILQDDPNQPVALHLLGVIAHQAGENDTAVELITKALTFAPDLTEAHNNLGATLKDLGRSKEAVTSYQKALIINPRYTEAHYNLGIALQDLGKQEEAVVSYYQALSLKPDYAEAHNNLGNALKSLGKPEEAVASYRKALDLQPEFVEAHNNLGLALHNLGKLEESATRYRKALAIRSNYVGAHANLGNVLQDLGKPEEAITSYRKALIINPRYAEAHYNLGNVLQDIGQPEEAVASYRQALALQPEYVDAHNNLGNALQDLGELEEAVTSYHDALALKTDFAEVHSNLGTTLLTLGRLDEAVTHCKKAIDLKSDLAEPHNNLGNALMDLGKLEEAITSYHEALALMPDQAETHSNLLFTLLHSAIDLDTVFEEHCRWEKSHSMQHQPIQHQRGGNPDKRLRVGFVSADLRTHSVSYFLEAPFSSYDRERMAIYCYSNSPLEDETTACLHSLVDEWRNIAGWKDEKVANAIQADKIDILVDLSGHTKGNRLTVFARKPAPIQMTWLGYPGITTGLTAMDYRLSDEVADPPGVADTVCIEQLIRLPNGHHCYQPPEDVPEIGPLPITTNRVITFGSFNKLAKITPEVVDSWTRILQAVPRSRLLLKNASLASLGVRERYLSLFATSIDPKRIIFKSRLPSQQAHFAMYNEVDIALDTFPFNGITTTCEALWMGVPVVTWSGDRHTARLGASLLTRVGLDNLVATDIDNYVETAVALATDPGRLENLRSGLRDRMRASPLCDGASFARDLENTFRDVWRRRSE